MSKISEDAFSAGWLDGLEYELWENLDRSMSSYCKHIIPHEELEQLRFLSDKCGCWIIFDNDHEETALDLESWEKKFNEKMRTI